MELRTNWELEQKDSILPWAGERTFWLPKDGSLVLAYDHYTIPPGLDLKGRVARIAGGRLTDIFEAPEAVMPPALDDDGNIYIATNPPYHPGERSDASTLYKVRADGAVAWKHELDAHAVIGPVFYGDSVFVADFAEDVGDGHLNRLTRDGKLVWKKHFKGNVSCQPLFLEDEGLVVMAFWGLNQIVVMDLDGNIRYTREVGATMPEQFTMMPQQFSRGKRGEIYACLNRGLVAMDSKLEVMWTYRPEERHIDDVPAVSASGDLYARGQARSYGLVGPEVTGKPGLTRLPLWHPVVISLDPQGKERWVAHTAGSYGYPCLLRSGEVLMATSRPNKTKASQRKPGEADHITFVEVFDDSGKRVLRHQLPGHTCGVKQAPDGVIYAATLCQDTLHGASWFRVYSFILS